MRKPVLAVPCRGTERRLIVCDDGTVWELVERNNQVVAVPHATATIPQPESK